MSELKILPELFRKVLAFIRFCDYNYPFYLFWAMRLRDVQNQWQRVIFMQTNREDLGDRYRLIEIPYTNDEMAAKEVSQRYRDYFLGLYELQRKFDHMSNDF